MGEWDAGGTLPLAVEPIRGTSEPVTLRWGTPGRWGCQAEWGASLVSLGAGGVGGAVDWSRVGSWEANPLQARFLLQALNRTRQGDTVSDDAKTGAWQLSLGDSRAPAFPPPLPLASPCLCLRPTWRHQTRTPPCLPPPLALAQTLSPARPAQSHGPKQPCPFPAKPHTSRAPNWGRRL